MLYFGRVLWLPALLKLKTRMLAFKRLLIYGDNCKLNNNDYNLMCFSVLLEMYYEPEK